MEEQQSTITAGYTNQQANVKQLVARFNRATTLSATQSATTATPARSSRVRQLTGAYETQLQALLRHLQDERARIATLRDEARARRAAKRHAHIINCVQDENSNVNGVNVMDGDHPHSGEDAVVLSSTTASDVDDAEDAALAAALEDVERMLAAHCQASSAHQSQWISQEGCSGGPGTPDRPLEEGGHPLMDDDGKTNINHDQSGKYAKEEEQQEDDAYVATQVQRVQNLLDLFRARHAADEAQRVASSKGFHAGPQVLEKRPSFFDPLTANSMFADPLRQAAFPLVCRSDDDDG